MTRLTSRQAAFVRGVAQGKSATQAAKDAGYSVAYADREASQLLGKPQIQAALADLTEKIASPDIATAAERQGWWSTVMRGKDMEMRDRLRASELLGKAQGDFIEKHEITVDGEILVTMDLGAALNDGDGAPA